MEIPHGRRLKNDWRSQTVSIRSLRDIAIRAITAPHSRLSDQVRKCKRSAHVGC